MLARQETQSRSRVELTPLSSTTWRVCNDRYADGDLRRVVGYLQTIDEGFEMLWMRPRPGVVYRYPTMDAAVTAISTRLELISDPD
jgi:hypothetical protein